MAYFALQNYIVSCGLSVLRSHCGNRKPQINMSITYGVSAGINHPVQMLQVHFKNTVFCS